MLATPERHGFSIVELVIVLAIMGVLVAVAAVRAYRNSDEAKANALMSEVRKLNGAAIIARQQNGSWPNDVNNSIVPPELRFIMHPNSLVGSTPVGGNWDWNGPGSSIPHHGFSVRFASASDEPLPILTIIESKFDDGNVNTGKIRRHLSNGRPFWCFRVE